MRAHTVTLVRVRTSASARWHEARRHRARWGCALGAALLGWLYGSATAYAGNDEGIFLGNDAAITAGAVTATARDGGALYYNVALLGQVRRNQLDASGNLFLYRLNDVPVLLRMSSGETAGTGGLEVNAVPSALTFLRRVDDRLTVGAGLFVTDATSYSQNASLQTDRMAPTRLRLDSNLVERNWHGTIGLGWELDDTLRLGVRLYVDAWNQQLTFSASFDRSEAGRTTRVDNVGTRSSVDVVGFGAGVGLHWTPDERLSVGLSVLSPRLDVGASSAVSSFSSSASVDDTNPELTVDAVDRSGLSFDVASFRPLMARAGIAYRFALGWVALDADLRTPYVDDRIEGRNVGFNVRVGGLVRLDETWSLGGGLFTDRSPYQIAATGNVVGARDLDFYGGTVGLHLRNRVNVSDDQPDRDLVFDSTVAFRYAYGDGRSVGLEAQNPPPAASQSGVAEFYGDTTTHEFSLHVGSGVEF